MPAFWERNEDSTAQEESVIHTGSGPGTYTTCFLKGVSAEAMVTVKVELGDRQGEAMNINGEKGQGSHLCEAFSLKATPNIHEGLQLYVLPDKSTDNS